MGSSKLHENYVASNKIRKQYLGLMTIIVGDQYFRTINLEPEKFASCSV